jgi:pimeloyl-ACP methyl ester carboxylesterase
MATATLLRRCGTLLLVAILAASCDASPPPVPATPTPTATPVASPAGGTSTDAPRATISWTDCGSGFQCGSVLVPLDYTKPAGASMLISVIKLQSTDPTKRIGSLVINPGGPGASGTEFVRDSAKTLFSADIRAHFDIVGFDPRGVNESSGIRCVDNLEHFLAADDTPDNATELKVLLTGQETYAKGCADRNGAVLPFLGTDNVARDLDRLRAALGDAKLTYLGFSYGTLIGALYAKYFPLRIRALVLDGAVDPQLDLAHLSEGQSVAFEASFKRFLAYCAADRKCAFRHGGKPGPAFETLMRRIEKSPLPATLAHDARLVGPSYAWGAVLGAMYNRAAWPVLAQGLALAEAGDGSILLLLSDPLDGRDPNGGYSNLVDANSGVRCIDFPGPRDPAPYEAEAKAWAHASPHFGALLAYSGLDCAHWAVPPVRVPGPVSAPDAPPIVVIGSTGDPATPYQWAVSLAHQLTTGVLITRKGNGHTGYSFSDCIKAAADTYLLALTVPKKGLVCTDSH